MVECGHFGETTETWNGSDPAYQHPSGTFIQPRSCLFSPLASLVALALFPVVFFCFEEHTIVEVLLQKDDEGYEKPIAYFSRDLRDDELKYNIMEK